MDALLALEKGVCAELDQQAAAERAQGLHKNWPITDGVVDEGLYLAGSPRMLWILKEAWEEGIEETGGGDWSVTKTLIPKIVKERSIGDKGLYARMAWVTYAVRNGYPTWQQLPWVSLDPKVGESLLQIAYINISKYPGQKVSYPPFLKQWYKRNQDMLLRQITTIAPDIIIGGGTLWLFLEDLGLQRADFTPAGSVQVCHKGGRLYIDAYHPSQRGGSDWYVDDIVATIKQFRQHWAVAPPAQNV
jgi:hypothetical protein